MPKDTILFISDDPDELKLLELVFSQEGFRVLTTEDCTIGFQIVVKEKPALIVMAQWKFEAGGFEVLKQIKEQQISTRVILCPVLFASSEKLRSFIQAGVCNYIKVPYEFKELIKVVKEAITLDSTLITREPMPLIETLLDQYERLEQLLLRERKRDVDDKQL
jgi:DNA-binding NtrC family response regulator